VIRKNSGHRSTWRLFLYDLERERVAFRFFRLELCTRRSSSPPASLAHFKHRAPSGTGPCNEQMPPSKRARESLVGERVGVGRSSLPEDEKKFTTGNTVSPDEKKFLRGKTPTDAESVTRGNYDISDPETLDCSICNNPLFLPVYQVIRILLSL
jgi:hypothetical protein